MTLILNTWIFETAVKTGTGQAELVDRVASLGADGIEVRREYFKDPAMEMPEVGRRAKKQGLIVNYSVPDDVFLASGERNPKLEQYFQEAMVMGGSKIKFNTGHFDHFRGDLRDAFEGLPLETIELNVENDQTAVSGNVAPIKRFLSSAHQAGLTQLGYVYDLGNWAFTHNDARQSARELAPYTRYIHLKNTIDDHGTLVTSADLNTGIYNWQEILDNLPTRVPIALEFPMSSDSQIKAQMNLLRARMEG